MRTLTIADNWKDWKFGDTDAVMTFTALDDNKVPDFSDRTLTFKIASTLNNDLEHPKDFAATATGYIQGKNVILKTEDVKQLTPGNYIVELWAMSNDTQKDAVYPSKGFAQFTIEENSMKVSDVTNIPSMTINAFWDAVMQKVGTLTKGAKGDPGKTPKIVMGSVTKLSPDAQPSATLVPLQSDPNTYTLNLQIPQGVQGEQGLQGIPGVGSKGLDGNNGLTPTIDPKTKHWMIGGTDTGVIAEGQAGKDADPSKYVTIVSFNQLRQQVQDNATALDKIGNFDSYTEPGNNLIEKIINEANDRGINVRHFGATGDGQTDDTDAFKKAIDYATNHNHSSVFVPAGKYVITKELTLNFISLFGEGLTSSTLVPKGDVPRLITMQWKAIVHNLRINNDKVTGPIKNICLAPESGEVGTNNIIRDVYFEDNGTHEVTAIDASPKTNGANQTIFSFPNVVDSITMSNIYNGIHLYSSRDGFVNGNVFQNITIQGFRNTGIWLDGGEGRSSISHNLFSNIQVQYQKDTPDTARAFKINYGVNNKFTMIHTWQDQGGSQAIPSLELQPLPGADSWDIRNNIFDGIFESEMVGNQETFNYNDLDGIRLSYWSRPSFKNGYGSLNTAKAFAENLLPENLIVDFVQGKRSPLQWDNVYYKPTDKGIDDKGYYVKFTRVDDSNTTGTSEFGLPLNRISDKLRTVNKYTVVIDFDTNGEDNANIAFQISSGYFSTDSTDRTVLPKGHHQMVRLQNGVYRYYETFDNSVSSSDPMFLYAWFGGGKAVNFRHFALVPGWIGPYQSIRETHTTSAWSITSPTKIDFTGSDFKGIMQKLKLSFIPSFNTADWFDKDLVQETRRSDGTYIYTYPIYL